MKRLSRSRRTRVLIAAVAMLGLAATEASAQFQLPPRRPAPRLRLSAPVPAEPSKIELGISTGLWNLMGQGNDVYIHAGHEFSSYLGCEAGFHFGQLKETVPAYRMVTARVRLMSKPNASYVQGYVVAGVGAGAGLSFRASPLIGVGIQGHPGGGPLSVRAGLSVLTSGEGLRDRGVLELGLAFRLR